MAARRRLSIPVANDWLSGGCVIQLGPMRHERNSAEGQLENVSWLTIIKHRKGNTLFPLNASVMPGSTGASLGPQRVPWRMKPTHLEEGRANGKNLGS